MSRVRVHDVCTFTHACLLTPDRHVIIETNNTTARIFPAVPDCETPEFWDKMERLIVLNRQLLALGQSDAPAAVRNLQKVWALTALTGPFCMRCQ